MRLPTRLLALTALATTATLFGQETTTAPAPLTAPAISGHLGAPVQLLGKDLADWSWHPLASKKNPNPTSKLEEVWSLSDDGILHSKGKPTGYLEYDKTPFTNYILTVEERHLSKGNGGLLVGIPDKPGKGWPGLEIQTMTDNAGDLWNHNLLKMTGDPKRTTNKGQRIVKNGPDSQKPVGEWDTMEVVVDHDTLTFKVNGVVQNVVTDTESLAGKVGLQAEGAPMEFRKIQITPIE
jgi:hypothetical protein